LYCRAAADLIRCASAVKRGEVGEDCVRSAVLPAEAVEDGRLWDAVSDDRPTADGAETDIAPHLGLIVVVRRVAELKR